MADVCSSLGNKIIYERFNFSQIWQNLGVNQAHNLLSRYLILFGYFCVFIHVHYVHNTWGFLVIGCIKGVSSPQGREGMQLVIIKNYMNIIYSFSINRPKQEVRGRKP